VSREKLFAKTADRGKQPTLITANISGPKYRLSRRRLNALLTTGRTKKRFWSEEGNGNEGSKALKPQKPQDGRRGGMEEKTTDINSGGLDHGVISRKQPAPGSTSKKKSKD